MRTVIYVILGVCSIALCYWFGTLIGKYLGIRKSEKSSQDDFNHKK